MSLTTSFFSMSKTWDIITSDNFFHKEKKAEIIIRLKLKIKKKDETPNYHATAFYCICFRQQLNPVSKIWQRLRKSIPLGLHASATRNHLSFIHLFDRERQAVYNLTNNHLQMNQKTAIKKGQHCGLCSVC